MDRSRPAASKQRESSLALERQDGREANVRKQMRAQQRLTEMGISGVECSGMVELAREKGVFAQACSVVVRSHPLWAVATPVHLCMCNHDHICACIHVSMCLCICMCARVRACVRACACKQVSIYVCIHTNTHTHTQTHTQVTHIRRLAEKRCNARECMDLLEMEATQLLLLLG